MNVSDEISKIKTDLAGLNDSIATKQAELAALRDRKKQLLADAQQLQAFLDWFATQAVAP